MIIDYRGFRCIPEAQPTKHTSPLFKKFITLAKKTEKLKVIQVASIRRRSKTYLRSNHEIFARAYPQYIAVKSKNPAMLLDLKSRQGTPVDGKPYPVQWDDEDFTPWHSDPDHCEIHRNRINTCVSLVEGGKSRKGHPDGDSPRVVDPRLERAADGDRLLRLSAKSSLRAAGRGDPGEPVETP